MSDYSSDIGDRPETRHSTTSSAFLFYSISRPTTASSLRSKLWSRERQAYEDECHRNMYEFRKRPYMRYEYPEIPKHYPGTWRTARGQEIDAIVARLTKKTYSSIERERDIKTQHTRVLKKKGKSTSVDVSNCSK